MPDIFRLAGRVDVETRRAEAGLRRVDTSARRTAQGAQHLKREFDQAGSAAEKFGGKLSSISSTLSVAGGNLLSSAISSVTGAMTDGVRKGIEYNKLLENSAVALETLGMSGAEAAKHLGELEQLSLKTPFEFQDVVKATLSMNAFGFSAQTRIKDLTALSDAAAIAAAGNGKFGESFQGIITAIGQMRAKGKVSAEEMNQLAERGIPAWDILAKKVGVTKAELMKLGEQGKLKGDVGAQLLTEGLGEFARGAGDRLSRTTQGKESNLADKLAKRAGEDVRASGALQAYQDSLDRASDALDRKAGQATTQATAGRLAKAYDAGSQILTELATGDTTFKDILKALPETLTGTFKELGGLAKSGGASIWQGISEGFGGALESTQAATFGKISTWADGLIRSAKDTLGIKSPSTVFAEMGRLSAAGFNLGLEAGKKKIVTPIDAEILRQKTLEELKKLRDDPRIKAMLDTIASAEGANYNTLFGGGTFDSYAAHPNQAITRKLGKGNITSTAAGRYQFLNRTWQGLVKQLGLPDFSPESQDLGAIQLMRQRRMIGPIQSGDIRGALTAGNREWASLPGSPYGQPTKKAETLMAKYNSALEAATGGLTALAQQTTKAANKTESYASGAAVVRQTAPLGGYKPLQADLDRLFADVRRPAQAQGKVIAGGELVTNVVGKLNDTLVPLAQMDETMTKLSAETALARAALSTLTDKSKGMDAVTKSAGGLSEILAETDEKLADVTEKVDRFGEAFGRTFDDLFDSLLDGRFDGKQIAKNLLKDISSAIIGDATGGKYNSPGQALGGLLSGALGFSQSFASPNLAYAGGGSGGGGVGNFARNTLSGGNGVLGTVASLFKRGGPKTIGGLPIMPGVQIPSLALSTPGVTNAISKGGGFLSKLFGGGAAAAAGAGGAAGGGSGILAALGFSNPISAIITGGLLAAPFIAKLFQKDYKGSLRRLIAGEYGVDVKDKTLLEGVKQIGESKFGRNFPQRQIETVRLPETRETIYEYAQAHGLKGNSKLFTAGLLQDAYSAMNLQKRASGGPVMSGMPYLVGERGPELFMPPQSGRIVPNHQLAAGGNEMTAALAEVRATAAELRVAIQHLRGLKPDQVVAMASPAVVTGKVARDFQNRGQGSLAVRDLVNKR